MPGVRKWSRILHRDLSYFFSGIIIIYAVSGITLNHKRDFNAEYAVSRTTFVVSSSFPQAPDQITRKEALGLLQSVGVPENQYAKHYFPETNQLKIFIKGGSSVVVDLNKGEGIYESLKKRPLISAFNRLHYNPGRWWTLFADIFAVSLLVITLTGLLLLKGRKGLWGRGGLELLGGILFPLVFILCS